MSRNFWGSFYRGWDAGDKISDKFEQARKLRDIRAAAEASPEETIQYDPAQFQDAAEKQGGVWSEADQAYQMPNGELQVATNTPTYDPNTRSYQDAAGQTIEPLRKYAMYGNVQAQPFTPEQVDELRQRRVADVYSKYGDVDKAMTLKNQINQNKLVQQQLESSGIALEQQRATNTYLKSYQEWMTGGVDDNEFLGKLNKLADGYKGKNGEWTGVTFGHEVLPDGKVRVVRMKDDKLVGASVLPNVQAVAQQVWATLNPENMATARKEGREDARNKVVDSQWQSTHNLNLNKLAADIKHNEDLLAENTRQFNEAQGLRKQELAATIRYQNAKIANDKAAYNALMKATPMGLSDDGKRMLFGTAGGELSERPVPPGYSTLFRKVTGSGTTSGMTSEAYAKAHEDLLKVNPKYMNAPPDVQKEMLDAFILDPRSRGVIGLGTAAEAAFGGATTAQPQPLRRTFRDAIQGMPADQIERQMSYPLYDSIPLTDADREYATRLRDARRAEERYRERAATGH